LHVKTLLDIVAEVGTKLNSKETEYTVLKMDERQGNQCCTAEGHHATETEDTPNMRNWTGALLNYSTLSQRKQQMEAIGWIVRSSQIKPLKDDGMQEMAKQYCVVISAKQNYGTCVQFSNCHFSGQIYV